MSTDTIPEKFAGRSAGHHSGLVRTIGGGILRYGLVFFLISSGFAKFSNAEALFIQPLVVHSPVFGPTYGVVGLRSMSDAIGVVELVLGVLLAFHRWKPRLAVIGGWGAVGEFIITLSFLFTTPGLSTAMQGFLLKDVMMLGAALWSTGESLRLSEPWWVSGRN